MARILVVDDHEDSRDFLTEYLSFHGYEVVTAGNGLEALDRLAQDSIDLVLMDLALPVLDGWEATRRLKADAATSHVPVVAVTAHSPGELHQRALAAGCEQVLTKPFAPTELAATVRRLVSTAGRSLTSSRP